jgi:hypothetical protein
MVFVHSDVVDELFPDVGVLLDPEPNLVIVILHLALDALGVVNDILRMLIDGTSVDFPSSTPIIQIDVGMYLFHIQNKALQTEGEIMTYRANLHLATIDSTIARKITFKEGLLDFIGRIEDSFGNELFRSIAATILFRKFHKFLVG